MTLVPKCFNCGAYGWCNCIPHKPYGIDPYDYGPRKLHRSNLWELCPKCHGDGIIAPHDGNWTQEMRDKICKVCNNTGLINKFTGKSPNNDKS